MPGENSFSHVPDLKGISVELPFCRFKYVKVQRSFTEKTETEQCVKSPVPARHHAGGITGSRVILARPAEITTLGVDPMISQASVIHELTHGRITGEFDSFPSRKDSVYPLPREEVGYSVDLFI